MDLLGDIRSHLAAVAADPAGNALDPRLLEKFDRQVTGVQPTMSNFRNDLCSYQPLCTDSRQNPSPRQTETSSSISWLNCCQLYNKIQPLPPLLSKSLFVQHPTPSTACLT